MHQVQKEEFFDKSEYVYAYTREQALADGVLVDVSKMAQEVGFKVPVAVTAAVWNSYAEWTDEDTKRQTIQDTEGRLWDMLWMLLLKIKLNRGAHTNCVFFEFLVVPRGGKGQRARLTKLKALMGPGDNMDPVMTILLPNED